MSWQNPSGFIRLPAHAIRGIATDPADSWRRVVDKLAERLEWRKEPCLYAADPDWEKRLHALLEITWPCAACASFHELWPVVVQEMLALGLQAGPESFGPWNDGDMGLTRAIWCLIHHLRPNRVVETGVAHGFTSRFILEALKRNQIGQLWSIDLPPISGDLQRQVGIAVPEHLRQRWTYIRGSSRRRLPRLLRELKQIDLFVHDSLHSERNVRFEMNQAVRTLTSKGAIVVDDVDANWGFHSFAQSVPEYDTIVCEAEPTRPDLRRFNNKGLFGIALKR
jgi:methyltransferase family protein